MCQRGSPPESGSVESVDVADPARRGTGARGTLAVGTDGAGVADDVEPPAEVVFCVSGRAASPRRLGGIGSHAALMTMDRDTSGRRRRIGLPAKGRPCYPPGSQGFRCERRAGATVAYFSFARLNS